MKKYLLGIFVMLFSILTVNASTSGNDKIALEGIKIVNTVVVGEKVVIEYELNPKDADNKNLVWSVSNLNNTVTATFINGNKTNSSSGKIEIKVVNTSDETVKITVTAKGEKNVSKSIDVTVNSLGEVEKLQEKAKEIEELIKKLPKSVTTENYNEIEEVLEKIDSLIYENENVENYVDEELMQKYEFIMEEFENYDLNKNTITKITAETIVTIVILALSFIFGLFIIFKKEVK